ncbi:50S ribosomal protein L20 [Acetobacterium paludosum]|uniref:Large ribosomal subunit protein bL20 n=3 Tax=Eubacteriaceae TaxID=186806 RepID=A0A923HYU6_9FIRM|nr:MULTISPECIES: 50S ribosomal protein L20 [Acetobacterium]MBC3797986.1 50S ribosomal protein L20 [Acetobacterium tundrae]MBC3889660.1 50S ribosomal protein L20 [Acetobacterium paludosum]
MMRIKKGVNAKRKHKKILKLAKGYYGAKSKLYRSANEAVMRALRSSYVGRKEKKRNFRRLWITRINAGTRMYDLSYSKFMFGLKQAGVEIDRKILADLAMNDADAFKDLVDISKKNLNQ